MQLLESMAEVSKYAVGLQGKNGPRIRKNLGSGFNAVVESLDAFKQIT